MKKGDNLIFNLSVEVISNQMIASEVFKIKFFSKEIASVAKPGQFIHLKLDYEDILLRRPFSFYRAEKETFELLFQIVGKGTAFLSKLKPKEKVDVLGPLGNCFSLPNNISRILLVAGGIGIAPLRFLAEVAKKKGIESYLLYGTCSSNKIVDLADFKALTKEAFILTEDGSFGEKAMVTDLLQKFAHEVAPDYAYACGPRLMLKEVVKILISLNIKVEIALEEVLGCGLGVCHGCVCQTTKGYQTVCRDGPVFEGKSIIWE